MISHFAKEEWWLMYSSFPDLNWARLRVFESGESEVFDMDGKTHSFKSEKDATNWLLEDEYISIKSLDSEDEKEYAIDLSKIRPPNAAGAEELKKFMNVKVDQA